MRSSRRMKRMERNNRKVQVTGLGLNLIPMMDLLTVLVFFLLFHSFNGDLPESRVLLPHSVVETKPRDTLAIVVSPEAVLVQGEAVIATPDLLASKSDRVPAVSERLGRLQRNSIGISSKTAGESREITILADKTIPFQALKKVMSTCTDSGYGMISLAVVQKAARS